MNDSTLLGSITNPHFSNFTTGTQIAKCTNMSELKTLSQLDSQCLKKCSLGLEFCFNHQIACMYNASTSLAH